MKKIITKLILVLTLALVSGGFIGLSNVWAEDGIESSMFVTPMSQELLLIPGETYEGVISVSNAANARENLNYKVEIGSYSIKKGETDVDDYTGGTDVSTRSDRNIMMDWIKIDKESGSVEPNGTDKIEYTITVPENAPAGAQYASILVIKDDNPTDNSEGEASDKNVAITSVYQIASVIYANVAGESIEKGSIIENTIPSFLLSNTLETTSLVKNEGNVYTNAEYTLQVWPLFSGEEICTNEEKPETSLVLPDTERYHSQTCDLSSIGIYKAKQTVKIFGEVSTTEKMVIVCPIWLLFLIIFAIIALIIWIVLRIRTHKKSSKKETA